MSYYPEQFASAIKANAQAQRAITAELSDKLIGHFEEFTKLSLDAAKATLTESSASMKEFSQANDLQEFFLLSVEHMKRDIQNMVFYGSEATRIASAAQIEFNKAAGAKVAEASNDGTALLTELTKNVPAGTEQFLTIFKSAMVALDAANELTKKMGDGAAADGPSPASAHQKPHKKNSH
ncbi:phasin family protein [Collimonas silvisoli]|uniref:phasin family protein n=1 Tax=Collimonas silvisoli TaxID=2825884 RepID=UPI001B8B1EEA|nr:phasin family protein [Collimonas silvisoli]